MAIQNKLDAENGRLWRALRETMRTEITELLRKHPSLTPEEIVEWVGTDLRYRNIYNILAEITEREMSRRVCSQEV